MLCEVILCRKDGRRLRRSEWPAPVVGQLVIDDTDAKHSAFNRNLRAAKLLGYRDSDRYRTSEINLVPPIFDPVLLAAPRGLLVLRGVELDPRDGGVYELEQVWLCSPKWRAD